MHMTGIVSLGYEGHSLEELVATCTSLGVSTVVDVRLNPLSRKPGLSKTKLSTALAAAHVGYVHMRALGNPKENRPPFWEGHIELGRRNFRELLLRESARDALDMLNGMIDTELIAVLCFEQEHYRCHRAVVIEELQARAARVNTYGCDAPITWRTPLPSPA